MQQKNEVKRKTLQTIIAGSSGTLHFLSCPVHGLPALLLKAGLMPAAVAVPLYAFHENVIDKLTDGMYAVSALNLSYDAAHTLAHKTVDYAWWISLGVLMTTGMHAGYSSLKKRGAGKQKPAPAKTDSYSSE